MDIRPSEISDILKKQITQFNADRALNRQGLISMRAFVTNTSPEVLRDVTYSLSRKDPITPKEAPMKKLLLSATLTLALGIAGPPERPAPALGAFRPSARRARQRTRRQLQAQRPRPRHCMAAGDPAQPCRAPRGTDLG